MLVLPYDRFASPRCDELCVACCVVVVRLENIWQGRREGWQPLYFASLLCTQSLVRTHLKDFVNRPLIRNVLLRKPSDHRPFDGIIL